MKITIRQTGEKLQVLLLQWLISKLWERLWEPHPAQGREERALLCAGCTSGAACKLQAGWARRGADTRGTTSSTLIHCALHLLLETQPFSTALFLVLPPSSVRSKQHLTSISCKTLSSHDAFGICRLIMVKNKRSGFLRAIRGEPCRDETLAYEAHYDHTAAVTFSMQQRKAGFSVQTKIRGSFQPFLSQAPALRKKS